MITIAGILVIVWLAGISAWLYRRNRRKKTEATGESPETAQAAMPGTESASAAVPIHLVAQPVPPPTTSPPWVRNLWAWTRRAYWLTVRLIDLAVGAVLFGLLFWLVGAALSHHVLGHGLTRSAVGHWIVGIAQWESRFVQRL